MEVDHLCLKLWDIGVDIIDDFTSIAICFHRFPSQICVEGLNRQREDITMKISRLEKFEDVKIMKIIDVGPIKFSRILSLFSYNYNR